MALERAARRSRRGVPEPDRLVARPRRDQLAVRRECDRADITRMALERAARRSRRGVPEPDRRVVRPRRDQLAVRRECDRADETRMALERAARRIPGFFSVQDTFDLRMSVIPEVLPNFTLQRTECKSSAIRLQRSLSDY